MLDRPGLVVACANILEPPRGLTGEPSSPVFAVSSILRLLHCCEPPDTSAPRQALVPDALLHAAMLPCYIDFIMLLCNLNWLCY